MGGNSLPRDCYAITKGFSKIDSDEHLLVYLINKFNLKNIAEIGVYGGNLTKKVMKDYKLDTYYCIDPWMPYSQFFGKENSSLKERTQKFWDGLYNRIINLQKIYPSIKILQMTSVEGADQIKDGSLDAAYIDAMHNYPNGKEDIQAFIPKIKSGGFICGHDYASTFRGLIKAVDEMLADSGKLHVLKDSNWYMQI